MPWLSEYERQESKEFRRGIIITVGVIVTVLILGYFYGTKILDCFPIDDNPNAPVNQLSLSLSAPYADVSTKVIVNKISSVENRFSGADYIFGQGSVTKSASVYYLAASDGTVCEVGLSQYLVAKEGEKYEGRWVSK